MKLKIDKKTILAPISFLLLILLALLFIKPISNEKLIGISSLKIYSRENILLRQFQSKTDKSYSEWVSISEYPETLIKAVITAEDKRFYYHPGFDILSIIRAFKQNILNRQIISGGSTITQQLTRLSFKKTLPQNRYLRKIYEIILAYKIDHFYHKNFILECYLNRVPMKLNQSGLPSASKRLFKKNITLLIKEESTALAVLIRQNMVTKEKFKKRYMQLWDKLSSKNNNNFTFIEKAIFSKNNYNYNNKNSTTLHFEQWIKNILPNANGKFKSTISNELNFHINEIINSEMKFLENHNVENSAVVVLKLPDKNNNRLELVSMLGSRNFYGNIEGQINGAVVIRSAGSSLKPFIYGYAMDHKNYQSNTIVHDRKITINADKNETYSPRNYDLSYWGPMTIREALATSRNIPVISVLKDIGIPEFYDYLQKCDFNHLVKGANHYGAGLALGTGGTSLMMLCRMYSGIANKGIMLPIYIGTDSKGNQIYIGDKKNIMTSKSAIVLTDILSDKNIRKSAFGSRNFLDFPYDVAAKTGTSKDFRDGWTVGFTDRYAVAVWIGNFSGKSMRMVSGGWGAGRIFHQVIRLVTGRRKSRFRYPPEFKKIRLCRKSGLKSTSSCPSYMELIDVNDAEISRCPIDHFNINEEWQLGKDKPVILSPVNGEVYILNPLKEMSSQQIPLKITLRKTFTDNRFFYQIDNSEKILFDSLIDEVLTFSRGYHVINIYQNDEMLDSVNFKVQ